MHIDNFLLRLYHNKHHHIEVCIIITVVIIFSYYHKGMSSDYEEVREMISVLIERVENCVGEFKARDVSNILYSLRGMSSDDFRIRDLLLVLVPKIQQCSEPFSAVDVGNALCGLQDFTSDHVEVRLLIVVLVLKIKNCHESFTSEVVSRSLYGLQGLSSDYMEVRTLIFALVPKIKNCIDYFDFRHLGEALYGLQGMKGKIESLSLSEYLYDHVIRLIVINGEYNFESISSEDLCLFTKYLMILEVNMKLTLGDKYQKWGSISILFMNEILERKKNEEKYVEDIIIIPPINVLRKKNSLYKFKSKEEEKIIGIIKKTFSELSVRASLNDRILNIFDNDIILSIAVDDVYPVWNGEKRTNHERNLNIDTNENKERLILNLEIDGLTQRNDKNIRYRNLRDSYLNTKGINIVRVQASDIRKVGELEFSRWLIRMVTHYIKKYKDRELNSI
jgi:hypothetical protein